MDDAPRFTCDGMLGHVARWLRLMGFDAEYVGSALSDDAILARVSSSGRVLATRDVQLHGRARRRGAAAVLVAGGSLEDELAGLLVGLTVRPDPRRYFTRCTHCNRELQAASPRDVAGRVPARVLAETHAFSACPGCGKVYWEGTHVAQIEAQLARLEARLGLRP